MDFRGKDRTTQYLEAVLVILVFILPSLAANPGNGQGMDFLSASRHLANIAVLVPQTMLLVYLIGLRGEAPEFFLRSPRLKDLRTACILLPLIVAAAWGGAGLAKLLLHSAPVEALGPNTPDLPPPLFIPLLTASALAIGYREELLYRVYLIRRLELAGTPAYASALLSTVLFAAAHSYEGAPGMLGAFFVGLLLSAAYLRTRNLHALAWAHATYDVLAILATSL